MSAPAREPLLRRVLRWLDPLPARHQRGLVTLAASFGLRFSSLLLRFLLAVLLARSLGPADYGNYSFALALVMILAVPVQLGLPRLVMRETARTQVSREWGLMKALWRWAFLVILGFSSVVIVAAYALLDVFPGVVPEGSHNAVYIGLVLIPVVALGAVRGGALRGLRRVVAGELPEALVTPLVFLVLAGCLSLLRDIGSADAMTANVTAAVVAYLFGAYLLRQARPTQLRSAARVPTRPAQWIGSVFTLALITGLQLINNQADVIMLRYLRDAHEVGVYRVANSAVVLNLVALQVITAVTSPYFTRLFAQQRMRELAATVTRASRLIFALSVPVVLAYLVCGAQLLAWVFGANYAEGAPVLRILTLAQAVNFCTGSVGALLTMTGHERLMLRGVLAATLLNVSLNALLIPHYGAPGAAAATGSSIVCWNLICWWYTWRTLGIDTTLLGRHHSSLA